MRVLRVKTILSNLAALSVAAALGACGGGTSTEPVTPVTPTVNPTITGLAATGAALANATVTVKCAGGASLTGKTGADGTFSIELGGGQVVPCLLEASNGTVTLHGFAAQAGHINITPLTDLVIVKALGSDVNAAFAGFDAVKSKTIIDGMEAAKTYVKAEMTAIAGAAPASDLMTGAFKIGDADDKLLDKLGLELTAASKSLSDLKVAAASGAPLAAALARGSLVEPAAVVGTFATTDIDGATAASGLQALSGKAKCGVKMVALNYNTVGVKGEKTNASGVMLVPTGSGCTTPAGLVAYARGTEVAKPRTLANPDDGESALLAFMYAAQGYAVVATDYLGYAKSAYAFHPYLHADSEATSVIDSIRAARNAAATVGATLSGKVMLTGYSQGGHAAMAAQRAIERDNAKEINVAAGTYMAGPYNLSGTMKSGVAIAGVQFFVPFMITAWQKVYGTSIYSDVSTVFKQPYANYVETLFPSPTLTYTTMVTTMKVPGAMGESPAQARDAILQPSFLADIQTNDSNPVYLAAKKNDLLGWSPKAKVMLCGGAGDPTVPPALNQNVMKADFDSRNLSNVTSVDVDAYVQATYGAVLASSPATYYGNYHGVYEPPFCHAQARALFDSVNGP